MAEKKIEEKIAEFQRSEITEYLIYSELARQTKDTHNKKVLSEIAADELEHYKFWKKHSGINVNPSLFRFWKYVLISRIFGLTFGIKLMENGEENAKRNYEKMLKKIPGAGKIIDDEDKHEKELIKMIDEEKLRYVGSIVLGINDALVELTGALAGLTLAIQNSGIIAVTGLITGIAAALSMAASEFLSQSAEKGENPKKAAVYTGAVYMLTVIFLVAPYFAFSNIYLSLAGTLTLAIAIIFFFTFYVSVAQDLPFRRKFLQMAGISLGVSAITFCIGLLVRLFLNVEV